MPLFGLKGQGKRRFAEHKIGQMAGLLPPDVNRFDAGDAVDGHVLGGHFGGAPNHLIFHPIDRNLSEEAVAAANTLRPRRRRLRRDDVHPAEDGPDRVMDPFLIPGRAGVEDGHSSAAVIRPGEGGVIGQDFPEGDRRDSLIKSPEAFIATGADIDDLRSSRESGLVPAAGEMLADPAELCVEMIPQPPGHIRPGEDQGAARRENPFHGRHCSRIPARFQKEYPRAGSSLNFQVRSDI